MHQRARGAPRAQRAPRRPQRSSYVNGRGTDPISSRAERRHGDSQRALPDSGEAQWPSPPLRGVHAYAAAARRPWRRRRLLPPGSLRSRRRRRVLSSKRQPHVATIHSVNVNTHYKHLDHNIQATYGQIQELEETRASANRGRGLALPRLLLLIQPTRSRSSISARSMYYNQRNNSNSPVPAGRARRLTDTLGAAHEQKLCDAAAQGVLAVSSATGGIAAGCSPASGVDGERY